MFGEDFNHLLVEFDAERVALEDDPLGVPFVTVDPSAPFCFKDAERGDVGNFLTMTLMHLSGDDGLELLEKLEQGEQEVTG